MVAFAEFYVLFAALVPVTLANPAFSNSVATDSSVVTILPGSSIVVNSPVRKTVRCMQTNPGHRKNTRNVTSTVIIRPGGTAVIEANTPTTVRCRGI